MRILSFEDNSLNFDDFLQESVKVLKNDGVVLLATDTCYGLSGAYDSLVARDKIVGFKKQDKDKSMTLLVSDLKMLYETVEVSSLAAELIEEFWPGPLTLILPAKNSSGYIGVRMPEHNFLRTLIKSLGKPIFSTSANLTGQKEAYHLDELNQQVEGNFPEIDLCLDSGILDFNQPSTILKIVGDKLDLIREGELWSLISQRF